MGSTQSTTEAPIDIANSFITDITTEVLNKNSTSVSGDQAIKISCTDKAFTAATKACSADTNNRNVIINNLISLGTTEAIKLATDMQQTYPQSCYLCSSDHIDQTMNISINITAVNNNTIANQIKADITSKLDQIVKNETNGGLGPTNAKVDAAVNLKTYVENKFNTKIVNETINTFSYKQTIDISNQRVSYLNQNMVANAVASAILTNAITNDSSLTSLIDAVSKVDSKTTGTDPLAVFGSIGLMIAIILGSIGILIMLVIVAKNALMSASRNTVSTQPNYSPWT
jgi:hypothetical protein